MGDEDKIDHGNIVPLVKPAQEAARPPLEDEVCLRILSI